MEWIRIATRKPLAHRDTQRLLDRSAPLVTVLQMSNLRVQTIDWPLREFPNREKHSSDEDAGEESAEQTGLKSVADRYVKFVLLFSRHNNSIWPLQSCYPAVSETM